MISEKRLLEMKNKLLEEVIDDAEEFLMWFAEYGIELIDEVLSYRAAEQLLVGIKKAEHGMADTQALKSLLRDVTEELSVYDDSRFDFTSKYAVLRRVRTVLGKEFPNNIYCGEDKND